METNYIISNNNNNKPDNPCSNGPMLYGPAYLCYMDSFTCYMEYMVKDCTYMTVRCMWIWPDYRLDSDTWTWLDLLTDVELYDGLELYGLGYIWLNYQGHKNRKDLIK